MGETEAAVRLEDAAARQIAEGRALIYDIARHPKQLPVRGKLLSPSPHACVTKAVGLVGSV